MTADGGAGAHSCVRCIYRRQSGRSDPRIVENDASGARIEDDPGALLHEAHESGLLRPVWRPLIRLMQGHQPILHGAQSPARIARGFLRGQPPRLIITCLTNV